MKFFNKVNELYSKSYSVYTEVISNEYVSKTFEFMSTNSDTIVKFCKDPSLYSGATLLMKVGGALAKGNMKYRESEWLSNNGWVELYDSKFSEFIRQKLANVPCTSIQLNQFYKVEFYQFESGERMAFLLFTTRDHWIARENYIKPGDHAAVSKLVTDMIWNDYGSNKLLKIALNERKLLDYGDTSNIVVFNDHEMSSYTNDTTLECINNVKDALEMGISRSIMLYGPPGTGKSTLARSMIKGLNMTSIRIDGHEIHEFSTDTLFQMIELFKPDAMIIDDLDRCDDQGKLLTLFELLTGTVKLMISTVNDVSKIDSALIRPGRFDEVIPFTRLDDDAIKSILGDNVDMFDEVKDWPIGYIVELNKRVRYMGKEKAVASMKDLSVRIERAKKQYNVDGINEYIPSNDSKNDDT